MAWLTGYPREKVTWFPTIDPEKCVKCGMCMNCGMKVYEWPDEGARLQTHIIASLDVVPVQIYVLVMPFPFQSFQRFGIYIKKKVSGQK